MSFVRGSTRSHDAGSGSATTQERGPGKQTLVQQLPASEPVQRKAGADAEQSSEAVHEAAAHGTSGAAGQLPHLDAISSSFGKHDVGGVQAHTDGAAAEGATAMGAEAFAVGNHVAFGGAPSLHTAAHEAAHVVQQRGGVQLKGGVGEAGDTYEQHADAVADLVVQGKSAEGLLDQHAGGSTGAAAGAGAAGGVQRKNLTQAKLAGGLTDSGTTLGIVGNNKGFVGRVYTVAVGGVSADRTAALVAAAAQNAEIGSRLAGTNWQGAKANFDVEKYKELDPFFLEVTVNFTHSAAQHQLVLRYQHAVQFNGYIVALKDTSNAALQNMEVMDVPARSTDPLHDGFKYGNRHDQTDGGTIAGLTGGAEEKNVDAYTKIGGEGARWECVRKHATKLKNGTRFFTKNPDNDTQVFGITFDKLWLSWKSGFKNKYDIKDGEFATQLRAGGTLEAARGAALDLSAMTADDYNLDTGAGHVVAL